MIVPQAREDVVVDNPRVLDGFSTKWRCDLKPGAWAESKSWLRRVDPTWEECYSIIHASILQVAFSKPSPLQVNPNKILFTIETHLRQDGDLTGRHHCDCLQVIGQLNSPPLHADPKFLPPRLRYSHKGTQHLTFQRLPAFRNPLKRIR
jgi:hypothetical protein